MKPHLRYENKLWRQGFAPIGIDEVGVGPLAGPVVAAAVLLQPRFRPDSDILKKVNDSKMLSAKTRDEIYAALTSDSRVRYAAAAVSPKTIDRINIYQAARRAMAECMKKLLLSSSETPYLLIDGNGRIKTIDAPQECIVGGDKTVFSIAAASIIAKVMRDTIMLRLDKKYPQYEFARHKGYGTKKHYAALMTHGPSPAHRKSFTLQKTQEIVFDAE